MLYSPKMYMLSMAGQSITGIVMPRLGLTVVCRAGVDIAGSDTSV